MNSYEKEMMDLYKKSLGEKTEFHGIVCPAVKKQPCRLCELCKEVLFNRSIPKEAPLRKRASSLNAKQHYFSNTLFLADPTEIVVLEYGDKIFKQLLAMQMNADQGFKDFWHPIAGRWMILERIQGATREQVDYYVKPKDPTKLVDMSVLSKMYDLGKIVDLVKENKVKSIYQSKLEKTSIIRILPSWLGPEFAMKFFEKVDYHYNISEEDFKACQAGEINPVRVDGGTTGSEIAGGWKPAGTEPPMTKGWGDIPIQDSVPYKGEPKPDVWAQQEKTVQEPDTDELPACYGDFDSTDPDCSPKECSDWADGCKAYRQEKLIKRQAAKRLSR